MKKKLSILVILLIAMITVPVFATNNEFQAGDKVNVEEGIESSSFIAGNDVKVSSHIDGINFVAGNDVSVSSSQDHLFAAGKDVKIENATVKDAFVAGYTISIKPSTVRNLFAAAESIDVYSNIERNAYLAANKVTIHSTINGDVKVAAKEIKVEEGAVINGTLSYPDDANVTIAEGAAVTNTEKYKTVKVDLKNSFIDKTTWAILGFLSKLVIAFVLLALCKKLFEKVAEEEKSPNRLFKLALHGALTLVAVPLAFIILLVTIIGIPLGLIALFLYILFIYLSAIPSAYYVGKWVLGDKIKNEYLLLFVSYTVIYLLGYVPVIGGLVSLLSLLLGMGLLVNQMKNKPVEEK